MWTKEETKSSVYPEPMLITGNSKNLMLSASTNKISPFFPPHNHWSKGGNDQRGRESHTMKPPHLIQVIILAFPLSA